MSNKKQYYKLDDIGFLGTQERSADQVANDAKRTTAFFKSLRNNKLPAKKEKAPKNK